MEGLREYIDREFTYNPDETAALRKQLKGTDGVSENDIRRIALWKYNRIIDVDTVETLLAELCAKPVLSIDDEDVQRIISELVNCRGVGFPLASTFLKFLRPEVFPIIDIRAYRALTGKKVNTYSLQRYEEYVKSVYELKEELGVEELYRVDEILYMFDKDRNGKI